MLRLSHLAYNTIAYTLLHLLFVHVLYGGIFFICIYVVALNNYIYVSVIYVLCLYECSWVILLTTCGCNTIVSTIEHTFGFNMKTTTGFHQWHSTTRHNHRIIPLKFIYLRYTVVFVYGVYKYTTVDVNAPYKRFKCIVVVIFVVIYVLFSTDFFICIYLCVYVHGILYMYIYLYISPLLYMCSYIDTYICFFKALHIDRTHVRHDLRDCLQPANRCSI